MICNLTIGATVVELAGGLGRASETSGLRIDVQPSFERVAYIGVNEARQFARPGASVSVSFDSSQTFSTLAEAETYILGLPSDLIDQAGATAEIGHELPLMVITGTLSPNATGSVPFVGVDTNNGFPVYSTTPGTVPATGPWTQIIYPVGGIAWELRYYENGLAGSMALWIASPGTESTPDLATGWAPDGSETGTPVFTPSTSITPSLTIYDAEAIVSAAHQGATVRLSVNLTGRLTAP